MSLITGWSKPPSSVPGPFRAPDVATVKNDPVSLPGVRTVQVPKTVSLNELSWRYYGNPSRANDIFNANRVGAIRSDGTPGFLQNQNEMVPAGAFIFLP